MRIKVIRFRRRFVKFLALGLAAALVGVGARAVVTRIGAAELQRPDLLIALGICVAVWLGGTEALPEA